MITPTCTDRCTLKTQSINSNIAARRVQSLKRTLPKSTKSEAPTILRHWLFSLIQVYHSQFLYEVACVNDERLPRPHTPRHADPSWSHRRHEFHGLARYGTFWHANVCLPRLRYHWCQINLPRGSQLICNFRAYDRRCRCLCCFGQLQLQANHTHYQPHPEPSLAQKILF